MAFGMLSRMIVMSFGDELTRGAAKAIANRSSAIAKWGSEVALPRVVAAGRVARSAAVRLAKDGFRAEGHSTSSFNSRLKDLARYAKDEWSGELHTAVRRGEDLYRRLEEKTSSVSSTMRAANTRYKQFVKGSIQHAGARKVIFGAVKNEIGAIPFNYAMYRYEKYQGNVPQDQGFGRWYASMAPLNLAAGAGFMGATRGMKMGWYRFNAAGGRYFTAAAMKGALSSIDHLRSRSQTVFNGYNHVMSRIPSVNPRAGFFSKITHAMDKLRPRVNDERPKTDMERFMQSVNQATQDHRLRGEMVRDYNKSMGRSPFMKLYNRAIRGVSRSQHELDGRAPGVEHLTLGHARSQMYASSGAHDIIQSREQWQMGSNRYDFGHLHIDRIRDFASDVINRDVRIMGRPWLRYLDAGRNLLMSSRSRHMQYKFNPATTPGYLGMSGESVLGIGRAGSAIEQIASDSEADIASKAARMHATWTGGSTAESASYHEQRIADAVKTLESGQGLKYAAMKNLDNSESVRAKYYHNYVANAREGFFKLGTHESLNVSAGYISVVSPYTNGKLMHFYNEGKRMKVYTPLLGGSRAANLFAMMHSSGSHEYDVDGISVNVGMDTPHNEKMERRKHLAASGWLGKSWAKIADKLELGAGEDHSEFTKMGSIVTKWNDQSYLPFWARRMRTGELTKQNILRKFDVDGTQHVDSVHKEKFRRNIIAGTSEASGELMDEVFGHFNSLAMSRGKDGRTDYGSLFRTMDYAIRPSVRENVHMPDANELRLNLSDYAIEMGDTVKDAQMKILAMRNRAGMDDVLGKAGMNVDLLDAIQGQLERAQVTDAWTAVSASSRGRYGSVIEDYNRNIFDMGVKMAGMSEDRAGRANLAEFFAQIQQESLSGSGMLQKKFKNPLDTNTLRSAIYLRSNVDRYRPGSANPARTQDAREFVDELVPFMEGYDKFIGNSLLKKLKTRSRKDTVIRPRNNENFVALITDTPGFSLSPDRVSITHIGDGVERQVAAAPISKHALESMAAIGTMNSALGFIGLGFDTTDMVSMTDIIKKTMTKRVLPFAGLYAAHTALTSAIQQTPLLQDTPLSGGVTGMTMDAYAGLRLASQTILDFTGIQSVASWAEDVMPGIVNSPLSAVVRGMGPIAAGITLGYKSSNPNWSPLKGGLVGGAVGMLLGGGPLGLFDGWDISQNRGEVLKELRGEKEVSVRKGRWWEMSAGSFWGAGTEYTRPSMYSMMKKRYMQGNNFLGNDIVTELTSYVDPSVYARENLFSRPYLESGKVGSNIPIIGSFINYARGSNKMHEDFMDTAPKWGPPETGGLATGGMPVGAAGDYYMYGGDLNTPTSGALPPAYASDSFESMINTTSDTVMDIAGLRGFLTGTLLDAAIGSDNFVAGNRQAANANQIGSLGRQYWNLNLGGLLGATESVRRIIPQLDKENSIYDPVPNTMPMSWMPGTGSQADLLHGDPYARLKEGEVRLPGETYELTHDVFYTYPIESLVMGQSMEEQIAYYSGDLTVMAQMRRNWDVVETTRREVVGRLKRSMQVLREQDMAYDVRTDTEARIDAIVQDPTDPNKKLALFIAPVVDTSEGKALVSGASENLNAYLVMNKREITDGILVGMDRDGNITKQMVHKDIQLFRRNVNMSKSAIKAARQLSPQLEQDGMPITHTPGYSHLNRLLILMNVAPYSKETQFEMKVVREQADQGMLGARGKQMFIDAMQNFGKLMQGMETNEYRFIPYMLGYTPLGKQAVDRMQMVKDTYSPAEIGVGAVWEYLSHLRNPVSGKLLSKRSAIEAYRQDAAIGKGFKVWEHPIDDYIGANISMLASERDPTQAFVSGAVGGAIFGGPVGATILATGSFLGSLAGVTSNTRASRWQDVDQVMQEADAVRYAQYMKIYNETGDKSALRQAKYTAANTYGGNLPGSFQKITQAINPNERKYVKKALLNMYAEDVDEMIPLLPEYMRPMFASKYGVQGSDYGEIRDQSMKLRNNALRAPLQFSADDMQYVTMSNEGMNAHDVGSGFYQQSNRMRYLRNIGVRAMSTREATQDGTVAPF